MDTDKIISLKDIECPYRSKNNEQLYLKGINLTVDAKDRLAIIGRPGAGKSALLRCINLLEQPMTGIVSIDNKNLTILERKELSQERKMIGYISHQTNLLDSKNIFANIALPLTIQGISKEEIIFKVESALALVNLEDKSHLYPQNLSISQRVRVIIARALVNNPKILLCDDLTTGLDHKASHNISSLMKKLNKKLGLTLVIVTSDSEIIKTLCNRVVVMQQGEIIEQCSTFNLFYLPQTEIAKNFVQATTRHELPSSLRRRLHSNSDSESNTLARLAFTECLTPEEIIGNTIQRFNLKVNIIQAYQETVQQKIISILIIEISGELKNTSEMLECLKENKLQYEVIGYVSNYT